jgi:hypothetical protein
MSREQVMEATAQVPVGLPKKWRNGRAAATNNPRALTGLTRQAQARRRHDLIRTFLAALGGKDAVSPVAMLQVKKAAELLSLAESVRSSLIGDPTRDVTGLVRLEGEARRTLHALGIRTEPPVSRTAARIAEIREARWAEQGRQKREAAQAAAKSREATENPIEGRPDAEADE